MRADDLTECVRILASTCGARLIGSVLRDQSHPNTHLVRLKLPNLPGERLAVWIPDVETFATLDAFCDSVMKVIDELVRKASKAEHPWSPYPIGAAP